MYKQSLYKRRMDPPTKAQLNFIKLIWKESDMPLKPFVGKTKGEAAAWIIENRHRVYHNTEDKEFE